VAGASYQQAAAASGIFADPKYKSTSTMNFRGQDKSREGTLGGNPNAGVEEEYIANLQQQVHFMELELKILKEKVVEDEKNSGIGSLFDDEKTSHQHIHLLKEKYMHMRKEFDKKQQDLNKRRLDIIGEQFVLNSQIDTITEQSARQAEEEDEFKAVTKKAHFEKEKKAKELHKLRSAIEADCRSLETQLQREQTEHFENTMTL
jgi:hypothetical protein